MAWLPRPGDRWRRWASVHQPPEEIKTFRVIIAIPPSWYTFGEQEQEHRRVPPYLHDVLRKSRAATQGFTAVPGRSVRDYEELAKSVLGAVLLVLEISARMPGMARQTCLMCESPVVEGTQRGPFPTCVSMERNHIFCGFWTLHEISITPSWHEIDENSPPKLCAFHADEFKLALGAVLFNFIVKPKQWVEHGHDSFVTRPGRAPPFPRQSLDLPRERRRSMQELRAFPCTVGYHKVTNRFRSETSDSARTSGRCSFLKNRPISEP